MKVRYLAAIALLAAPLTGCGYNRIQTLDETATKAKQNIVVQLQRRADLVPALLTGNASSGVIILCDQPEPDGTPAAILRTRMLAAIGLDIENAALLHRLPWPTTGARAPRPDELASFAPFVGRALELARPRYVLALGQHAAALAGEPMALASARGRWSTITVGDADVPLLATCHPRLLLSQPARKREAWTDLQAFAARLME